MNDIRLVIIIVRRDQGEDCLRMLKKCGAATAYAGLCRGTASGKMLDYLGIERSEKCMLQCVAHGAVAERLLRRLGGMGINARGGGIAMTIPVGSIGGASCAEQLMKGQKPEQREVEKMNEYPYALIVAIANKGNTDMVMDAARGAGARGGTVTSARGTADGLASKFFGISITQEKEIIYIAAKKEDKNGIMKAIMNKAGVNSDAHTVLFSIPIESIAGFAEMTDDDEKE